MTALQSNVDTVELTDAVARVVHAFSPAKREVTGELAIEADLGFNSLSLAELAFAMEDLFGLEPVVPEVAVGLRTVADIEALIAGHLEHGDARLPGGAEIDDYLARYAAS